MPQYNADSFAVLNEQYFFLGIITFYRKVGKLRSSPPHRHLSNSGQPLNAATTKRRTKDKTGNMQNKLLVRDNTTYCIIEQEYDIQHNTMQSNEKGSSKEARYT